MHSKAYMHLKKVKTIFNLKLREYIRWSFSSIISVSNGATDAIWTILL